MQRRSLREVFEREDGVWTARDAVRRHFHEIAEIKELAPGIPWEAVSVLLVKAGILQRRIGAKTLANYYHEAKAALNAEADRPAAPARKTDRNPSSERAEAVRENTKPTAQPAAKPSERASRPQVRIPEEPSDERMHETSRKYPIFEPDEALGFADDANAPSSPADHDDDPTAPPEPAEPPAKPKIMLKM